MKQSALSELARNTPPPPISWLMSIALSRPNLISLAAGFTDNESLPVEEAREIVAELLEAPKAGRPALQYGTTAGDPELRRLSAKHLQQVDGASSSANYSPEQTVMTNGSQQMLYMLTEVLCDPGDIVLVEDPTYFVYLGIAQSHRLRCRGIRLQADGIDLAHLEEVLESLKKSGDIKRLKMLYLVTYFQNPTATTTSIAKKLEALKLLRRYEKAAGHPIYLLEDAAYRELQFTNRNEPSALSLGKFAERVLYAGTYSKPFATGIRVGFGILPPEITTVVLRVKGNHDFGTANLLQQLMVRAMASSRYDKHLVGLRQRYAHKAAIMVKAIKQYFPAEVQWAAPEGGLYVWARAPRSLKTGMKSKFFETCLNNDVFYVPGELCYCEDATRKKPNHEMRLSFGGASDKNIELGISRLGEVLKQSLAK